MAATGRSDANMMGNVFILKIHASAMCANYYALSPPLRNGRRRSARRSLRNSVREGMVAAITPSVTVAVARQEKITWQGAAGPIGKNALRLLGRNLQIGKVALGARSDPQCDSSVPRIELEIIDDQAGLLRSVYVEPRFAALHLDLVLGPDTGLQIDVRLILFGSLLPRSGEVKIRIRTVLRGVISPDLIVGSTVRGSEINVLVSSVALDPKSDANKPARVGSRTSGRLAGHIHFDHAVTKRHILDQGIRRGVCGLGLGYDLDRTPALIVGLRDRYVLPYQSIGTLGRKR